MSPATCIACIIIYTNPLTVHYLVFSLGKLVCVYWTGSREEAENLIDLKNETYKDQIKRYLIFIQILVSSEKLSSLKEKKMTTEIS